MSALLLKDWYMAKKYCGAFMLVILVFLALSFVSSNVIFYTYPCMMAGLMPYTLYSYDERERFTAFCATMPVTRRQYVSEKYLFGLIASAVTLMLTLAAVLINGEMGAGELLPVMSAAVASALISEAVMLPFGMRFGAEKGRIMFLAIVAVLFASLYIVMTPESLGSVTFSTQALCAAALAASVALLAASWLISQRVYSRKEL